MISNPEPANLCPRCGKPVSISQGICPSCLLSDQLMNTSLNQTLDFASRPLIENPEQDLSIDDAGKAQWHDPLAPGLRVGQFEIVKRLGRGGMGTVYEAQDVENQRRVALKVLSRPVDSQEARQRFLREGRLAASINHPNSVFVFGTHQVDRWSLISMELVDGGTLEQQVRKHGSMKSRAAVDAALQIIDGLQAAYRLGVLHRDIKPANCFQGLDGTIKIGDFGLSISMETQPNSRITTEGLFLGTPAFSSPEQLRGDALDVRSDIYAFGVTLYYLLTGQTPFKADGMIKLLALVLESSPTAPHSIRPEIPADLSRIVMRCLSKEPGDRFRNYAELRDVLAPFSSAVAEPASLGPRAVAGIIDDFLLFTLSIFYTASFGFNSIDRSSNFATRVVSILYFATCIIYFAFCEAAFGQTLGKRVLGLQVIDSDGYRPSVFQAIRRAAIFVLVPAAILLPENLLVDQSFRGIVPARTEEWLWLGMVGASSWIFWAILFCKTRRGDGQSVLLDYLSGTRVVTKSPETRKVIHVAQAIAPSLEGNNKTIGPYYVLESLPTNDGSQMFVGYDTMMLRRVWLRQNDKSTSNDSTQYRSSLARATRLRWLNQLMDDGNLWDVYEAPSGQPFVNRLRQPTQWHDVKYCLVDISKEISAALQNDTLPKQLDLDHVWLTDLGHIKLLDFVAPNIESSRRIEARSYIAGTSPFEETTPEKRANHFLSDLAVHLEQTLIPRNGATLPPPVSVSKMLGTLKSQSDFSFKMRAVHVTVARHEIAPRKRRILMAITCYASPFLVWVLMATAQMNSWLFFANNPDIAELYGVGSVLVESAGHKQMPQESQELYAENPERYATLRVPLEQFRRYHAAKAIVASEKVELLKDPRLQSLSIVTSIHSFMRSELDGAASGPKPSSEELAAAKELLADDLKKRTAQVVSMKSIAIGMPMHMAVSVWWIYVCIPATIAAILFRGGLVMHGFQVAVVRMNGRRVGRFGVFIRSLFPYMPGFAALACLTPVIVVPKVHDQGPSLQPIMAIFAVAFVVTLVIVSNFIGLRSLTDRILGTAIVSK